MKRRPPPYDAEMSRIDLGVECPGDMSVGIPASFHRVTINVEDLSDDSLEGLTLDLRILFASWFDTNQDRVRTMEQWKKIWAEETEEE